MTTKLQQVIARSKVATLDNKLRGVAEQVLRDKFGDKKSSRATQQDSLLDGSTAEGHRARVLSLREIEATAKRLATMDTCPGASFAMSIDQFYVRPIDTEVERTMGLY